MNILAHRGHWLAPSDRNSGPALARALEGGFGIETDVRDAAGVAVISHDMALGGEMTLDALLALCARYPSSRPLALNIKADGLQTLVEAALRRHAVAGAFVFDMALPDALGYLRRELPTYTRASEYEHPPLYLDAAAGVWLDAFHDVWYERATITAWLETGLEVAIVSPELHGRPHQSLWTRLRDWGLHLDPRVSLCTDFPLEAKDWFSVKS